MRGDRRVAAGGALVVARALWGCGRPSEAEHVAQAPAEAPRPDVIVVTVTPAAIRSVERTVSVVGTLEANQQADLASETEGQVMAVRADLGDRVARGQVLLEVRSDVIEAQLQEARRVSRRRWPTRRARRRSARRESSRTRSTRRSGPSSGSPARAATGCASSARRCGPPSTDRCYWTPGAGWSASGSTPRPRIARSHISSAGVPKTRSGSGGAVSQAEAASS